MKPLDTSEMQISAFTQPAGSDLYTTGHWTSPDAEYLNQPEVTTTMAFEKGYKPWNKGKKTLIETRIKLSLNNPRYWKGKKLPWVTERNLRDNPAKRPEVKEKISRKGTKHSEETKILISKNNKGKGMFGKHHSEESRRKIGLARLGKPSVRKGASLSEEAKKKISLANKGRLSGAKNPFYGKTHDELTKSKIRQARLNQIFPLKDTKPEKLLQEALFWNSINFKTHVPLPGQPDIFIEPNLCVFVDGDFFHGNPITYRSSSKLLRGIIAQDIWSKDQRITQSLESKGYTVLRFWEHDIHNNLNQCVSTILDKLN